MLTNVCWYLSNVFWFVYFFSECGRKFGRYASFKSHLAIHQEEDNLTCPDCEQEFTNEVSLIFKPTFRARRDVIYG